MRLSLLCAALTIACTRASTPPPPPTVAALAALHDALERGDPAPAVDPEAISRAELLQRLGSMHDIQEERVPLGITEAGWRRALDDIHSRHGPAGLLREFAPARALLGDGRCAQIAPAPLPDALSPVADARPTWPAFVEETVRAPLARRGRGARAGDFHCEGGSQPFRAVFLPSDPPDGALRVARITPR